MVTYKELRRWRAKAGGAVVTARIALFGAARRARLLGGPTLAVAKIKILLCATLIESGLKGVWPGLPIRRGKCHRGTDRHHRRHKHRQRKHQKRAPQRATSLLFRRHQLHRLLLSHNEPPFS